MKKKLKILSLVAFSSLLFIATPSCTDLKETIYDQIMSDEFYKTEEEIISAMAPAYGLLRNLASRDVWHHMGEASTDISLYPTRGRHWYNDGSSQRLHEHTWNTENALFEGPWTTFYRMVNQPNMLMFQFGQLEDMDEELRTKFLGELEIIRALGYWNLLDLFGNVPIVDRFDIDPEFIPTNNSDFETGRREVFKFIENDLMKNIPNLDPMVSNATYGRFHKWAAHALALKLYINADVWTGTPRWDEAIAHADAIINSGLFQLEDDYFANFLSKNNGSKENIFVVPFNETQTGSNMTNICFLSGHHYEMNKVFGTPRGGNNGTCGLPSHYKSFDKDDIRRRGWLVGVQRDASSGAVLKCTQESAPNPLEITVDFNNIYDPNDKAIYNHQNALEYHGPRSIKYEIAYKAGNMGNDLVVYRYADILLLKAEALIRKNGGVATQEAADLVNMVRSRAFDNPESHLYTIATLTLDELLAERAREFYSEGMRRNDLVRFGKYVRGTWEFFDRSNEGDYRNVFPIPQKEINLNTSLKQNPGY